MCVDYWIYVQSQPTTENVPASSRSGNLHTSNPPQPHHSDQHQSPGGPGNGSLDDTRNRTLEHGKNTSSKEKVEVVEETRYIHKNVCWTLLNAMLLDVVVFSNQLGERVSHRQHSSIIIYFKNYKVLSILIILINKCMVCTV